MLRSRSLGVSFPSLPSFELRSGLWDCLELPAFDCHGFEPEFTDRLGLLVEALQLLLEEEEGDDDACVLDCP